MVISSIKANPIFFTPEWLALRQCAGAVHHHLTCSMFFTSFVLDLLTSAMALAMADISVDTAMMLTPIPISHTHLLTMCPTCGIFILWGRCHERLCIFFLPLSGMEEVSPILHRQTHINRRRSLRRMSRTCWIYRSSPNIANASKHS